MAAKYNHVSPHIWTPAFRELRNTDPNAFELYLYLLTCRHRSSEGLFVAPLGYIEIDLGMAEPDVKAAMCALEDRGYVQYDHELEVVLDRHALDYYEPTGKQALGALNKIESLPKTPLKVDLLMVAYINAPRFADLIVEKFPELLHLSGIDGRSIGDRGPNHAPSKHASKSKSKSREPSTEDENENEKELEDENENEKELEDEFSTDSSTRAREEANSNGSLPSGWLAGQVPLEWCIVCSKDTHMRDPDGRPRHSTCEVDESGELQSAGKREGSF